MLKYSKDGNEIKDEEEKKCNYNYINENIPKVIKNKFDDKLIIEGKKQMYIGLDLGDTECKLCMINEFNNEIILIGFKKDLFKIPTLIYFDENTNIIKIGVDAENSGESNPSQIIFNLLKFVGSNYDEIIGKKDLWPFKLYKNEKNLICINLIFFGLSFLRIFGLALSFFDRMIEGYFSFLLWLFLLHDVALIWLFLQQFHLYEYCFHIAFSFI